MFLKTLDLTPALRPSYLPDEVLLFVQDNVGLYEGFVFVFPSSPISLCFSNGLLELTERRKLKIANQQNGQVYLTSHRICYVDKKEPRTNSVALELKDVDRCEFYAGFLKSSSKITVFAKPYKRSLLRSRATTATPPLARHDSTSPAGRDSARPGSTESALGAPATWVCTICSYSNPISPSFDPADANAHTPLPPCLACGIKPALSHVLKAAISSASRRPPPVSASSSSGGGALTHRQKPTFNQDENAEVGSRRPGSRNEAESSASISSSLPCPRCTFVNHPSLPSCEMCGAPLTIKSTPCVTPDLASDNSRTASPGPSVDHEGKVAPGGGDDLDSIKLAFRGGGERTFHERLKGALTQRKWLLQNAPPAPKSSRTVESSGVSGAQPDAKIGKAKTAGIAGLEQLGLSMRKNNALLIGSAFEDLDALMASAKEVVALAERFARQGSGANGGVSAEENAILAESASQLGLITTKDIVGGGGGSESLYLSELSRNVAEFLSDDSRGVLKKAGGIMTLVDLWAMFNRARGGVELVSPMDFEKAARMWESLRLPVRLRTFRSGVVVVQGRERTDESTIKALLSWLMDLHAIPPERDVPWDWRQFGRGVTAQEAAERFGWGLGVAEEELLMAEERGALCREEGLEGLKFWKNYIDTGPKVVAEEPLEAASDG